MKKMIAFALVLFCVFGLAGCLTTDEMYGKPVFETENIMHITFYKARTGDHAYEVPSENMEEITAWLGTFTIGPKLIGEQPAGLNSTSVKIEYEDGTVLETCLDTETIADVIYYTECGERPECYYEILEISE